MPLPPQKFREAVFQILFMSEFACLDEEAIPFMMAELKTTRKEMQHACQKAKGILEKQGEIDAEIGGLSTEYQIDRISRTELTILRLGLFEMLFEKEIPPKVAIAEGIRLCRKFGTNESAQFVNAILDGVHKKYAPVPVEPAPV